MKILVLEDDRNRIRKFKAELVGHDVDYAETSDDAIRSVAQNCYDLAFLDHDLGGLAMVESDTPEYDTGYKFAKRLVAEGLHVPEFIIVHSLNVHGADNIKSLLTHAVAIPFIRLDISGAASRIKQFLMRNEEQCEH